MSKKTPLRSGKLIAFILGIFIIAAFLIFNHTRHGAYSHLDIEKGKKLTSIEEAAKSTRSDKEIALSIKQYEIGMSYYHGVNHPQNDKKAREWFIKSALGGNKNAQSHLGMMLFMGYGGEKNISLARHWLSLARTPTALAEK